MISDPADSFLDHRTEDPLSRLELLEEDLLAHLDDEPENAQTTPLEQLPTDGNGEEPSAVQPASDGALDDLDLLEEDILTNINDVGMDAPNRVGEGGSLPVDAVELHTFDGVSCREKAVRPFTSQIPLIRLLITPTCGLIHAPSPFLEGVVR